MTERGARLQAEVRTRVGPKQLGPSRVLAASTARRVRGAPRRQAGVGRQYIYVHIYILIYTYVCVMFVCIYIHMHMQRVGQS